MILFSVIFWIGFTALMVRLVKSSNQNKYPNDLVLKNEKFSSQTDLKYFSQNNSSLDSKTYIDDYGYRRFSDSDKLVSHWVAEKFLIRRKLNYGEVVHHIDGNRLNNKPSNLMVFVSQEAHLKHHQNNYKYGGDWHSAIPEYTNYKKAPQH